MAIRITIVRAAIRQRVGVARARQRRRFLPRPPGRALATSAARLLSRRRAGAQAGGGAIPDLRLQRRRRGGGGADGRFRRHQLDRARRQHQGELVSVADGARRSRGRGAQRATAQRVGDGHCASDAGDRQRSAHDHRQEHEPITSCTAPSWASTSTSAARTGRQGLPGVSRWASVSKSPTGVRSSTSRIPTASSTPMAGTV